MVKSIPPCDPTEWWNSHLDTCIRCTECEEVVLRTCQPHTDTICGSFDDLGLDLNFLAQQDRLQDFLDTEFQSNNFNRQPQQQTQDLMAWDWPEISLIFAAVACVVFFIAALYLTVQHARQWRQMEKRFDSDMEEMSTKLMAKLAKVQGLESGSAAVLVDQNFCLDGRQNGGKPAEFHCVYLEQLLGKGWPKKGAKRGNVYIEDKAENFK